MELSILLAEQIAALFLMMAVGYFLVRIGMLQAEDSKVISNLVVYVCSPCVVLDSFQITLTQDRINGLLLATAGAVLVHIALVGGTKLLEKPLGLNSIEKASIVYSNAGNLIIPLVTAVLGKEWVFYTVAYIIVQTVLIWTHGISVINRGEKSNLKGIIKNPNIIAILVGMIMLITGFRFPVPIRDCASGFASMIGPAGMIVIGMLIGKVDLIWVFRQKRPYFICVIRLLIFPVIFILIFSLTGMQALHPQAGYILLVVLLAGSAPAAAIVTQLAQIYNKDSKYASVINVMSVIFCIVTMPLITLLYEVVL